MIQADNTVTGCGVKSRSNRTVTVRSNASMTKTAKCGNLEIINVGKASQPNVYRFKGFKII